VGDGQKNLHGIWPFANSKNCNRHFLDMADLNFLKAIDNPGLTPSSSLRTALLSVFEL
jgi:hypothetical protein